MVNLKNLAEAQSPSIPVKETKSDISASSKPVRKRGTVLTLWLVLLILGNTVSPLLTVLGIRPLPSSVPLWIIYPLILSSVLLVVSAIAMLAWKKWGFYLLCAIEVLAIAVNLLAGAGVFAFVGLIGLAITYLLLRSSWSLFE
jgi:hypothetical protein